MKIVICWSNFSGYSVACWRELSQRQGVELFVFAFAAPKASPFNESVLAEIPHKLLSEEELADTALVTQLIADQKPDILKTTGWFVSAYRAAFLSEQMVNVPKFMLVDTPWRHLGQYLTKYRYPNYLGCLDGVGVPGERAWQYAKNLGFKEQSIRRHMYGIDEHQAEIAYEMRKSHTQKSGFIFVGRYAEEKGIDVLVQGYKKYREQSEAPWELHCCGRGPLAHLLENQPGISDHGFVQPSTLPELFKSKGAYLMCSTFDPWPLALAEAALAGMPIIATEACGSAVEIVRSHYNGFFVPTGDPDAVARAMLLMESADIDAWGDRSKELAAPFSSKQWADRWLEFFSSASPGSPSTASVS